MICQCCTFIISGKKLIAVCEDCKNNSNSEKKLTQFKWYEKYILIIRDDPEKRLFIELVILFGYIGMLILCYLEHCKLTFKFNSLFTTIIAIIFTGWFGLVFGYAYIYQILQKEEKFYLKLDHNE